MVRPRGPAPAPRPPDVLVYTLCVGEPPRNEDGTPDLRTEFVVTIEWHRDQRPEVTWRRDQIEEVHRAMTARIQQASLQIQVSPKDFRGGFPIRCGDGDGQKGCGESIILGALAVEKRGELEGWWAPCPRCGKRWWVLTTDRTIRQLQKRAARQVRAGGQVDEKTLTDLRAAIRRLRTLHLETFCGKTPEAPPPQPGTLDAVPDSATEH